MDLLSFILIYPYAIPLLIGMLTVLLYFIVYQRPQNYPPGPMGLPLIGVLPLIDKTPERLFQKWSKKYGVVISVRIGMTDLVVLNDYESIQEAFVKKKDLISGRPRSPLHDIFCEKGHGLIFLDYGQKWKTQRKFGFHTFRGLGVGKKSMEDRVIEEATHLCEAIHEFKGKPFDIMDILSNAIAHSIGSVTVGQRFETNDPKVVKLLSLFTESVNHPESRLFSFFINLAPFLKHIPPFFNHLKAKQRDIKIVQGILQKIVEEHKSTLDPERPRDFVDAFLLEMYKGENITYTETQLGHYLQDLLFAGTETTTNTLRWAIVVLLHYPEAQKRLREEILSKIGSSSIPSYSDRTEMPYTCAFMEELYRFRTLGPLALPHKTNGKVKIGTFHVPADTKVLPNIWAVHNDPQVFPEPEAFKPDRHLNSDRNFVKSKHVIPFSLGARHCLGEQLARMEVFIFLVSLVRNFNFRPVSEGVLPEINKGLYGSIFNPLPFEIVAEKIPKIG